jgi:hypothetical protein
MTDTCKICGNVLERMTATHFKKHGVKTWVEYNALPEKDAPAEEESPSTDSPAEPVMDTAEPPTPQPTTPKKVELFCGTCMKPINTEAKETFFFVGDKAYHRSRTCHHLAR